MNFNPYSRIWLIFGIKSNPWRMAISCGQCQSSKMIYYAEMHRQTVEKLTWLKGAYYIKNPSIRFMFVTFQYYCICWMSKLPRLKIKHHKIMMTDQFECAFVTGFRDNTRIIYLLLLPNTVHPSIWRLSHLCGSGNEVFYLQVNMWICTCSKIGKVQVKTGKNNWNCLWC